MIRHIVLFSAKNTRDVDEVERGLLLLADIPGAQHFEVRRNLKLDSLANEVDVVVYSEFADQAALDRYKQHPLYEESIRIVRPLRELRVAVDVQAA